MQHLALINLQYESYMNALIYSGYILPLERYLNFYEEGSVHLITSTNLWY